LDWRKILVIISALLLALSVYAVWRFHNMPIEESHYVVRCRYEHSAFYDYLVGVNSSVLYGNRTVLSAGKPVFLKLVRYVNITFNYFLSCDKPIKTSNSSVKHWTEVFLSAEEGWNKTIETHSTLKEELTEKNVTITEFHFLDLEEMKRLIEHIEEETAFRPGVYSIHVVPHISLLVSTDAGEIRDYLAPELIIKLNYGSGGPIQFEGLKHSKTGSLGGYEVSSHPEVIPYRLTSYIATVCLAGALAIELLWLYKPKKPEVAKVAKKKLGDMLAEGHRHGKKIILKSIEDVATVAEVLAKPIIHNREGKVHIYRVYDETLTYELSVEEESKNGAEGDFT